MGGTSEPITYKELLPPEARKFRQELYDYILNKGGGGPLWGTQIESFPGTLPYTQAPDPGQLAGLNTVMKMLGYGGYTWPGMPGAPASGNTGGGGNQPAPGAGPGGGGGTGGEPPNARRDRYRPKSRR